MSSSLTMYSSQNNNPSISKVQDISERFKFLNQSYCTNVESLTDRIKSNCKNKFMDLKDDQEISLTEELTYYKQLYLFSTSHLNVIPKNDFSEKECGCKLCEIKKTRSPFYKCAECNNFYYCQNCFFLCIDKHPHQFVPHKHSREIKNKMAESYVMRKSTIVTGKFNSKVMNKEDLIVKREHGLAENLEIKIVFKNTGKEKWKKNQIYLDYTADSEIREVKECISQECDIGNEIEVYAKISVGKIYPGNYSIKLGLLQPQSLNKFFGEIAEVKIMVGKEVLK